MPIRPVMVKLVVQEHLRFFFRFIENFLFAFFVYLPACRCVCLAFAECTGCRAPHQKRGEVMTIPIKVSIYLPTCNRPELIVQCLDSCLAQTHTNFEIVIGDDSKDERTQQLIAYERNHSDCRPRAAVRRNHDPDHRGRGCDHPVVDARPVFHFPARTLMPDRAVHGSSTGSRFFCTGSCVPRSPIRTAHASRSCTCTKLPVVHPYAVHERRQSMSERS